MNAKLILYKRSDGKWAWRFVVHGNVIAVDGSQGYENKTDAISIADRIISGEFKDADKEVI